MLEAAEASLIEAGAAARATAEGFDVNRMADQMIDLYERLLGRGRAGGLQGAG